MDELIPANGICECGAGLDIEKGEFLYFYTCPECGKVYDLKNDKLFFEDLKIDG
ncbi:hypothetical protein [uncultured Clostridium sp.]|uniref:hypothetical protein n=1 Tax=uncultured Clostridium sp. TaxID=59620 RepID=UPI0025D50409|nr:hypothetical protein [uncultured Clostridium sp.]